MVGGPGIGVGKRAVADGLCVSSILLFEYSKGGGAVAICNFVHAKGLMCGVHGELF